MKSELAEEIFELTEARLLEQRNEVHMQMRSHRNEPILNAGQIDLGQFELHVIGRELSIISATERLGSQGVRRVREGGTSP
jgi:hypothetical protein